MMGGATILALVCGFGARLRPNLAFKRDAAKARRLLTLRYAN